MSTLTLVKLVKEVLLIDFCQFFVLREQLVVVFEGSEVLGNHSGPQTARVGRQFECC